MFKKDRYDIFERNMFLLVNNERWTRRHEDTSAKKQCILCISIFSFSQITIIELKKLSADFVNVSNVNMSKTNNDM